MNQTLNIEELRNKAIAVLSQYEEGLKDTANEGDIEEHLLGICKYQGTVSPYWWFLTLGHVMRAIAKPGVQKEILKHISESTLCETIDLIDTMGSFFLTIHGDQFDAMLCRYDIANYPEEYSISTLEHKIDETERKMKQLRTKIRPAA